MVWYSHLFKNVPQFVVIHTVKGFGIVNKAEQMFFWNSLAFYVGHNFSSKDQASFNFLAAVTICSDFRALENKFSHFFHCFPIYLP